MKAVINKVLFAFASLWHCAVSFVTPYCLPLTIACFADIHNDDGYIISFLLGCFILFFWSIFFLPSFIYLTATLKKIKKILAFIPTVALIIFALIGFILMLFTM